MKKIYLAGPLFTLAEIEFNNTLHYELTQLGFDVFLPQNECQGLQDEHIFLKCKEGIDSCNIIVAILDGADADSGTCWECGYGFANNKHIIGIRTDFRSTGDTFGGFNAMLYYCANKIISGNNYLSELKLYLNTI
jgi:nucleoside 2-deoxyribosyltransferase